MHAAVLVRLLLQPSHNFLAHLPAEVFKNVRKYSVAAILYTDPAAHRQHMETWASHAPKWAKHVATMQSTAGAGLQTHDLPGQVRITAVHICMIL
jgi:3'5'-cyclic nucleotide phosphodiesterase